MKFLSNQLYLEMFQLISSEKTKHLEKHFQSDTVIK